MVDDTAAPFQWGSGGARLTPEEIAAQRKVADALLAQAGSTTPFAPGTRGAGGQWTQGLAQIAKGISAGMDYRQADQASKANDADNKTMIAALLGGGATPAAAVPAPVASSAPVASAAPSTLDPETTGYIKNAADKFGVDPAYLQRTALIESGGKADATNPSGAAGLFQFMPRTAKEYGLDNPLDPEDSAMAAAELAADNRKTLADTLGRNPTNAELYLAHQQGADGAAKLLANPNVPAVQAVGRDAVLQNGGSENMTAGQFANKWLSKFGGDAAPVPAQVAQAGVVPPVISQAVARVAGAMPVPGQAPAPDAVARVAGAMPSDDATLPAAATPTQGYAVPGQPAVAPAVAKVASALPGVNPAVLQAATSPYASESTKKIAGIMLASQIGKEKKDTFSPTTDADGNQIDVNNTTHERKMVIKASEDPSSVREYEYAKKNAPANAPFMSYPEWTIQKARAAATTVATGAVTVGGEDKGLNEAAKLDAEAVRKGQNEKMPALDDADRNFQMMQDAIDRNGGKLPTGGVLAKLGLDARRTAGYIRENWGVDLGDDPTTATSLETFNKGGIKASGDMAKAIGGSRVLKVEFDQAQRANPGLETTDGGNKYLIDLNRNTIAIQKDHLQAQEDYWREHNHSLDGFQKSWNSEVRANPRPLSTFSVVPPVNNEDGTQMVKLPSTAQGGYSWYQKGPNGNTVVSDPAITSKLEAGAKPLAAPAVTPAEKTIGGKTYVKQDGNWFEKH